MSYVGVVRPRMVALQHERCGVSTKKSPRQLSREDAVMHYTAFECVTQLHIRTKAVSHWLNKRESDCENAMLHSRTAFFSHSRSRHMNSQPTMADDIEPQVL